MTEKIAEDFLPEQLPTNPMQIVASWLNAARSAANQPNPNAMTLATQDPDGTLAARIVLCKRMDSDHGTLDFFTNYRSRKAQGLAENPRIALVFHWDHQGRQVRLQGHATQLPDDDNDAYFETRPRLSQMGAWASDQSEPIASRAALIEQFEQRNAAHEDSVAVPRPPHWGGYRVQLDYCELWVEGGGRVHDRAAFRRSIESEQPGPWTGTRLQP